MLNIDASTSEPSNRLSDQYQKCRTKKGGLAHKDALRTLKHAKSKLSLQSYNQWTFVLAVVLSARYNLISLVFLDLQLKLLAVSCKVISRPQFRGFFSFRLVGNPLFYLSKVYAYVAVLLSSQTYGPSQLRLLYAL